MINCIRKTKSESKIYISKEIQEDETEDKFPVQVKLLHARTIGNKVLNYLMLSFYTGY